MQGDLSEDVDDLGGILDNAPTTPANPIGGEER